MSTYLVAVIVGEFHYIEDTTSDGILVRVYTPVDKAEQGRFSLEVYEAILFILFCDAENSTICGCNLLIFM